MVKHADALQAYKRYPITHFSRWRFWVHLGIVYFFIIPFVWFKWHPKVYGRKNMPRKGSFIVASNHISTADPMVLGFALRYPIAYMAKTELFNAVWKRAFYRLLGTFALDRDHPDSATLKTALNVLKSKNNWALGLFPEGTRSITGAILPLKKGVGDLAQKTNTPILPVGLRRDENGNYSVKVGRLITDISNPEASQEKLHTELVTLTRP